MDVKITDKDIEHAIRNCHWRFTVNGQRNLHLCGGACNVCEHLIESGKCDTLQRLFRKGGKIIDITVTEDGLENQEPTQEAKTEVEE